MPQPVRHTLERTAGAFLEVQRGLGCADCNQAYLGGPDYMEGEHSYRQAVGGGTIVASRRTPITEVHIVPHGGSELPAELLEQTARPIWRPLAELVHLNADTGTGTVYARLAERISSGELDGAAVAGFHLSRLLIDANRVDPQHQTPARPYVGEPDLYEHYLTRNREKLREAYLDPWVYAVNELLAELENPGVVYHHHTYDLTSMSPRPYDLGELDRPAFQLVWKRPDEGAVPVTEEVLKLDPRGGGLARMEDLKDIRDNITNYLADRDGAASVDGYIDYPLELPLTPFLGTFRADLTVSVQHVMYDIRKDFLDTEEKVLGWVDEGPWRLPGRA
jgi:N-formylglutamate amidohydrolase